MPSELERMFAPFSSEFARNPYKTYAAMRREPNFWHDPASEQFFISRYDDIVEATKNPNLVRSLEAFLDQDEVAEVKQRQNLHDMPYHSRLIQTNLLDSDGEKHDRIRKKVFKHFMPISVARLRDSVQAYVNGLMDRIADEREIDFVEDLAAPVPGHVIDNLLGFPDDDREKLRQWSDDIVQYFDIDKSDERKKLAEEATEEFYEYICSICADRTINKQDDLISHFIEIRAAGQFSEEEFASTCMLILMAGHGSTLDVLGSGMHSLLRFPEQMTRLRQDPSLIDTAVQEMFRFESPLPYFHRYAAKDCEIGGQHYPKGTRFGLLYGSANRDPEQFDDADEFHIGRRPNRHVAFGGGAHFCLGNHISRLNMSIVFVTLLERFSDIELIEEPEYKPGLAIRGPRNLSIRLTPA